MITVTTETLEEMKKVFEDMFPPTCKASIPSLPKEEEEEEEEGEEELSIMTELDSTGLPWDARIHNKGKRKASKDGTWIKIKNLKNTDPELIDRVEAELRGKVATKKEEVPPTPPPPAPPAPMTFPELNTLVADKGYDLKAMNALAQSVGVEGWFLLVNKPDKYPEVIAAVGGA